MKLSDKTKEIISAVAPTLGMALGGPFGALAGNVLSSIMGEGDTSKIDAAILSGNPDTMLKLKQGEHDFQERMRELDIQEKDLETKDRDSARQLFKVNQWPQIVLSSAFIGGYFFILDALLTGDIVIADTIKDTALLLLGLITREVPTIMQFWFGSSTGSKHKDIEFLNNKV